MVTIVGEQLENLKELIKLYKKNAASTLAVGLIGFISFNLCKFFYYNNLCNQYIFNDQQKYVRYNVIASSSMTYSLIGVYVGITILITAEILFFINKVVFYK